jgi:hypothetical protein
VADQDLNRLAIALFDVPLERAFCGAQRIECGIDVQPRVGGQIQLSWSSCHATC